MLKMVLVAKSYQGLEQIGPVFESKNRNYIQVKTKNGSLKTVRVYSDYEYRKMYPEDAAANTTVYRTQKEVLGFEKGYITIFRGNTYEDKEYFKFNSARYHKFWGWYFISTDELPDDIPEDVAPIRLDWELVGNEDGKLKPDSEVVKAVESLIYEPDESEFQGEVGEKIHAFVTVEKNIQLDGYYGPSNMHIMRDDDGNCFVWTTTAKNWPVGSEHSIIGTIKALSTYKGTKQTVLTRCRSED